MKRALFALAVVALGAAWTINIGGLQSADAVRIDADDIGLHDVVLGKNDVQRCVGDDTAMRPFMLEQDLLNMHRHALMSKKG